VREREIQREKDREREEKTTVEREKGWDTEGERERVCVWVGGCPLTSVSVRVSHTWESTFVMI